MIDGRLVLTLLIFMLQSLDCLGLHQLANGRCSQNERNHDYCNEKSQIKEAFSYFQSVMAANRQRGTRESCPEFDRTVHRPAAGQDHAIRISKSSLKYSIVANDVSGRNGKYLKRLLDLCLATRSYLCCLLLGTHIYLVAI
jgi:hypothetical protein